VVISYGKNQISADSDILRITTVRARLRYPKNRNEIRYDFGAGVRHQPNLGKNTCFKWISQAVLDNAKVWSDTVEKTCFDRDNEFVD
jgi:hypothetical protein